MFNEGVSRSWLQFEFGHYLDRSLLDGTGLSAQASGVCASRALVESVVRREAVGFVAHEGI
jgi:hypothetical protein